MEYYRSQIGYVQQTYDVPRYGFNTLHTAYKYTVEDVIHCGRHRQRAEFIVRQPDGYDSVLGDAGVDYWAGASTSFQLPVRSEKSEYTCF